MTPILILSCFLIYTAFLFTISWYTGRKSDNNTFFTGNHQSPWYVVAYGMIGASLSGVTFISVPGDVGNSHWTYLMIVAGYVLGYVVIAHVLLPLYYRLHLTSIYTYLEQRFGTASYKTGAFFFLLSRVIGASFRMFLVVNVLQLFVFDTWNIPFAVTVALFIGLILLYTFKGGIKTIVWTDTLQTTFMLVSVVVSLFLLANKMDLSFSGLLQKVWKSEYTQVVNTDWTHRYFFLKQFISGMFITIVMTGLDQDMMQKNLTCKNVKEARWNVYLMSFTLVPVNFIFLVLGATLFVFAAQHGITVNGTTDDLFPLVAINYLGPAAGVVFFIGLIAAAYSSADSALTALTTSFAVDFLGLEKRNDLSDRQKLRMRYRIHIAFAVVIMMVIILFRAMNDESVISGLFRMAGYTYGPLLGLYAFGLFTRYHVKDKWVPVVAVVAPMICYYLNIYSQQLFNGYRFGFELLIVNGILTFIGLLIIRNKLRVDNE